MPELILESASLCPLEHIVLFPIFSFLCELSIDRWRIEVVEDSVSLVRRCVDRVCHSCNLLFILIEIYFLVQWYAFKWIFNPWMCLIAYVSFIIYSRVVLTLYYRACLPCLMLLSKLLMQAGLEKAQWGSTTTIRNKVCVEIL